MKPVFTDAANIDRLTLELERWLGTPWAHLAGEAGEQRAVEGIGGDCKTILATAYANAGFIERLDFPAHCVAPGLESEDAVEASVTRYLAKFIDDGSMVRLNARKERLISGDILTFRWGARDHHLGACHVINGRPYVYHVPGPMRRFMLSPLSEWFPQLRSAYRLMRGDA